MTNNYNKNGKLKYFNYNIYRYMAKNRKKLKKEKETRKCYKYNKVEYLTVISYVLASFILTHR